MNKYRELSKESREGKLLNFQDIMKGQSDFHKERPGVFPPGWRTTVLAREDWIKNEQEWPATIRRREKEETERRKKDEEEKKKEEQQDKEADPDAEKSWRRGRGRSSEKYHEAYGKSGGQEKSDQQNGTTQLNGNTDHKTEYQKLRERYSPEEITLLRHLKSELEKAKRLEQNDGSHESPIKEAVKEPPSILTRQINSHQITGSHEARH